MAIHGLPQYSFLSFYIQVKNNITYIRGNVTEDLWELTRDSLVLHQDNWTSSVVNRLKSFENELVMAMRYRGWDGSEDPNSLQWTFHGALFYSIIVITTIGMQRFNRGWNYLLYLKITKVLGKFKIKL